MAMGSSRQLLTFLLVSLVFMLGYAVLNFFIYRHVEDVIDQAPEVSGPAAEARTAACERAWEHHDRLFEQEPAGGNYELRERRLDAARREIDRTCPAD